MLNEYSFSCALRVFNKTRSSLVGCLRAAIEVFRTEEAKRISLSLPIENIEVYSVNTYRGPDTGLVIIGFKDSAEAESFLFECMHAPGQ